MKFSILKENLQKGLNVVNRIIPLKPQLPILNNILIKASEGEVKMVATNLETGITISVGAKTEEEGEITVPGKLLTEYVAQLPAEKIEINLDKEILTIKTNKTEAKFNTLSSKEFPPLFSTKPKADMVLSMKQLSEGVGKTAFASSIDEGRPVLTGIKLRLDKKGIQFSATDGYRLSIIQEEIGKGFEEEQIILAAKTLVEVVRIAEEEKQVEIGLSLIKDKNQVVFSTTTTQIVTRLIDGEFPNVEKIIPISFKTRVEVDKEEFLQSVKIASLFARGASNIVKLKILKNGISVSANTPQVGENQDFIDAKVEGEEAEVAFNFRFLLDLLNNFSEKQIVFETTGALNPGVFKPIKKDSTFLHIIMPVRLQT